MDSDAAVTTELIGPPERSVADRTKFAVDQIVENVCVEFSREVSALRAQLDQFEKLLMTRASKTKGDMLAFVDLVKAGHALTEQISARLDDMRQDVDHQVNS